MRVFELQLGKHCEVCITSGSVAQSHVDPFSLQDYQKNSICSLPEIETTFSVHQEVHHRCFRKVLSPDEVSWLSDVYRLLYPQLKIIHIAMFCQQYREVNILGVRLLSKQEKGKHSFAVCAFWPSVGGCVSQTCDHLRVGILYNTSSNTLSS